MKNDKVGKYKLTKKYKPWYTLGITMMFLLFVSIAHAEDDEFFDEAFGDRPKKPKEEAAVVLPAFPKIENLLPFNAGPADKRSYALDAQSISVGEGHAVYYTIVTTSRSGARTINHEGLRCGSHDYKQYAYGRQDGTWVRARINKWRPISTRTHTRFRATLSKDYFCDVGLVSGTAEQIVERVKYKNPVENW